MIKPKIAVITPTMESRKKIFEKFCGAWAYLFAKHNVWFITVTDGDEPTVQCQQFGNTKSRLNDIFDKENVDLIFNKSDVVRNLGFYFAYSNIKPDIYITLDDDVLPLGDPIQDHIDALNMKVSINWMNTADYPMRGLPYGTRNEAQVMLSHGVWQNVPDLDAPNQLVNPDVKPVFYKGVIPKGIYYPMCIMNVAFRKEILPYMYQVPMNTHGMDRFGDIWSGVLSKRDIDEMGCAVVSGYATIWHDRASNVFKNLQKEAKGLELNETFWKGDETDPYFKLMREKRDRWINLIKLS
jgi:reversibly glycosylated polypeptide/UDP-arabinopyranose mutase